MFNLLTSATDKNKTVILCSDSVKTLFPHLPPQLRGVSEKKLPKLEDKTIEFFHLKH